LASQYKCNLNSGQIIISARIKKNPGLHLGRARTFHSLLQVSLCMRVHRKIWFLILYIGFLYRSSASNKGDRAHNAHSWQLIMNHNLSYGITEVFQNNKLAHCLL